MSTRDEWRCASTDAGALSVTTTGTTEMQTLCVDSSATRQMELRSPYQVPRLAVEMDLSSLMRCDVLETSPVCFSAGLPRSVLTTAFPRRMLECSVLVS